MNDVLPQISKKFIDDLDLYGVGQWGSDAKIILLDILNSTRKEYGDAIFYVVDDISWSAEIFREFDPILTRTLLESILTPIMVDNKIENLVYEDDLPGEIIEKIYSYK